MTVGTNSSGHFFDTTLNADGVLYSDSSGVISSTTVGTSGQVLTSNGVGVAPTFQAASSGGITTIAGDSGTATGSTVTFNANTNCGASIVFAASGSTVDLKVTDANSSIYLGESSGNPSISGLGQNTTCGFNTGNALTSGHFDCFFGALVGQFATSATNCCGFGYGSLSSLTTGLRHAAFGQGCLGNITTGNTNIGFGNNAGTNYTSSESSNIVIGNQGTAAESNVIRIGTQGSGDGQQNKCFIAGIAGVSVSNKNLATIDSSTGQLGSDTFTSGNFTPTITFGGGNTGITYTTQTGQYWQIGPVVYVSMQIVLSNKGSSTGTAEIRGLPVTSRSGSVAILSCLTGNISGGGTAAFPAFLAPDAAGTKGAMYFSNTAAGVTALADTNFTNTSFIDCTGFYFAS